MQYYDVSQADSLKKVYIRLTEEGAVFSDIAIKMPEDLQFPSGRVRSISR